MRAHALFASIVAIVVSTSAFCGENQNAPRGISLQPLPPEIQTDWEEELTSILNRDEFFVKSHYGALIWREIQRVLRRVFDVMPWRGIGRAANVMADVITILMWVLVVIAALLLISVVRRRLAPNAVKDDALISKPITESDEQKKRKKLERDLQQALQAGQWLKAMTLRYELMIRRCGITGKLPADPSRTLGEVQHAFLKNRPSIRNHIFPVTRLMNSSLYGFQTTGQKEFQELDRHVLGVEGNG